VFVFPSTVEAMSMMLLEALALGATGVAGDTPENTSILPPGYPPFAFAAKDAGALARQLAVVLAWDGAAREALKQQGREWVRGRYEELYQRAVAG
jgi:glycosyltransferase involved in cell wall biosynthesis